MGRSLFGSIKQLFVITVVSLVTLGLIHQALVLFEEEEYLWGKQGAHTSLGAADIYYNCIGNHTLAADKPIIVFLNKEGGSSLEWASLQLRLSKMALVCSFDIPGQGYSEEVEHTMPLSAGVVAGYLRSLFLKIKRNNIFATTSRLLLVGHSFGGIAAQIYADRYPEDVAGVVLLNSFTSEASIEEYLKKESQISAVGQAFLHYSGLGRLLLYFTLNPFASSESLMKLPLGYRTCEKLRILRGQNLSPKKLQLNELWSLPLSLNELRQRKFQRLRVPLHVVDTSDKARLQFIERFPDHHEKLVRLSDRSAHYRSVGDLTVSAPERTYGTDSQALFFAVADLHELLETKL